MPRKRTPARGPLEPKPTMPRAFTRETFFERDITLSERGATKLTLHVEVMSIDNKPPALSLRVFKESPTYGGPTPHGLVFSNWDAVHELMDVLPDAALAWAKAKG